MVGGNGGLKFSQLLKLIQLPWLETGHSRPQLAYSRYGVLFLICSKVATDFLENFHLFLVKNRFFSTHKIMPAIRLLQFERGPSGLPFACSWYGLLFLRGFKMAPNLLENFQARNYYFLSQFSQ